MYAGVANTEFAGMERSWKFAFKNQRMEWSPLFLYSPIHCQMTLHETPSTCHPPIHPYIPLSYSPDPSSLPRVTDVQNKQQAYRDRFSCLSDLHSHDVLSQTRPTRPRTRKYTPTRNQNLVQSREVLQNWVRTLRELRFG